MRVNCLSTMVHEMGPSRDCFQAAVGQCELIGNSSVFTSQANASLSLGSHPAY